MDDFFHWCEKEGVQFAQRLPNGSLTPMCPKVVLEGYEEYRKVIEEARDRYHRGCASSNTCVIEGCEDSGYPYCVRHDV